MKINTMGIWGDLHQPLNLEDLYSIENVSRITKSHLNILLNDKITACIFSTGKVQIYGNKNVNDVQYLWQKILSVLEKFVSLPYADKEAKIKFLSVSATLPYSMNLRKIIDAYPNEQIEYEPEVFPGLIWKLTFGTCLIFTSGNIIVDGPNSLEKIEMTITELRWKTDKLFM